MSIVSLKILSFKTYSRIEAVPFSPFTCIVGPNGVGKSNLIDAILFVLGAHPSEIRGSLPARDSPPPTAVEANVRDRMGNIIHLRRELANEVSSFYINGDRVTGAEYSSYLDGQNISTVHRNFLISQNESLIKSPKDLTKFIDKISGSAILKEDYKNLKKRKEIISKEYHEILERKRSADVSAKEYEEVVEMQIKHRELIDRRRAVASSKIKKRRVQIRETKKELEKRKEKTEKKEGEKEGQNIIYRKMAEIQTRLIKAKAIHAGVKHQEDALKKREEERIKQTELSEKKRMDLQEKIAEARMQIEDCEWAINQAKRMEESHAPWTDPQKKDLLVRTLSQIQRIEDSKNILHLKIAVTEIEREAREEKQKEEQEEQKEEPINSRLAKLNSSLLETLKGLSYISAQKKGAEYSSRLGYLVGRIKSTMPQVIGRVGDLIKPADEKYAAAVHAVLHGKMNTIIIEQEKDAQPILTGLAQSGAGRVTVLPLNRLRGSRISAGKEEKENRNILHSEYVLCADAVVVSAGCSIYRDKVLEYVCGSSLIYIGKGNPAQRKEKIVTLDGIVISPNGIVKKVSKEFNGQKEHLELRRERLLEEIKRETENSRTVEKEREDTPREIENKLAEAKAFLAEAQKEIEKEILEICRNSKIPDEIIRHAREHGVVDRTSAETKIEQIERKSNIWKRRLIDLTAQERSLPTDLPENKEELVKISTEEVSEEIRQLENELQGISQKVDPSVGIEGRLIQEQILQLNDEMEEIEQYMAEEGITEEEIEGATSQAEEDIEKIEREIASIGKLLSQKDVVPETRIACEKLARETEEKKQEVNEAVQAFHRIRKERTGLFMAVFDRLNSLINQNYGKLTEKGSGRVRAHLGLESPQEPYLGGTQIFVMPTGKTFREAKYLSGGEITMVALSLLLSVDVIYPSLFYIFDELDAALDKEKISSLRGALEEINAQFIAVTHRLELFEKADTLVGVAKPPKGHSQIFTLKLDE